MTSDAKIGLLLGLVFIFVIAFIINGLPGLHQKDDSNKLTTNMVGLESNPSGIGANERKVQMALDQPAAPAGENVQPAAGTTAQQQPMTNPVPVASVGAAASQSAADNAIVGPMQAAPTTAIGPTASAPAQDVPSVSTQPAAASSAAQSAPAKVYVVQSGDSISGIAKKVYGVKEGVKQKNIDAIFAANRKTLSKIDELQVGQKLIIPSISGSTATSSSPTEVLTDKNFTKVESVGQQHSTANADKPAATAKSGSVYVVKEGDSLWKIAATQLGDGNRYREIVKMNSNILSSEDDIAIGMQLKMPAK